MVWRKNEFKHLTLATKESCFIFNNTFYKQNDEVAIRYQLGPSLADAYLVKIPFRIERKPSYNENVRSTPLYLFEWFLFILFAAFDGPLWSVFYLFYVNY